MIHPCPKRCKSEFQDSLYGVGRRVHNPCKGPGHGVLYGRCTVCKEVSVVGHKKEEKKGVAEDGNES